MDAVTAKHFLMAKVLREADASRVQISEVESKMLYFTEVHPSPAFIREGNAEFERDDDAGEYENKVAQLVQNARARDANISPSQEHDWNGALDALKKEDHYILVMVGLAFGYGASSGTAPCRPPSSDVHLHRNCSRSVSSSDNILVGDPRTSFYDPR